MTDERFRPPGSGQPVGTSIAVLYALAAYAVKLDGEDPPMSQLPRYIDQLTADLATLRALLEVEP